MKSFLLSESEVLNADLTRFRARFEPHRIALLQSRARYIGAYDFGIRLIVEDGLAVDSEPFIRFAMQFRREPAACALISLKTCDLALVLMASVNGTTIRRDSVGISASFNRGQVERAGAEINSLAMEYCRSTEMGLAFMDSSRFGKTRLFLHGVKKGIVLPLQKR